MIYGTNHFVSDKAAMEYYIEHGFTPCDIERKVGNWEIVIGKPFTKPNERLVTLDGGRRYGIETL